MPTNKTIFLRASPQIASVKGASVDSQIPVASLHHEKPSLGVHYEIPSLQEGIDYELAEAVIDYVKAEVSRHWALATISVRVNYNSKNFFVRDPATMTDLLDTLLYTSYPINGPIINTVPINGPDL